MSLQGMGQQQAAVVPAQDTSDSGGGAIGPVIGVLAVIMVLAVAAWLTGRLCTGRRVFGLGGYDVEGWMGKKFGRCIDGRVEEPLSPAPPQRPAAVPVEIGGESVAVTVPVEVIIATPIPEPLPESAALRSSGGFPGSLRI